MTTRLASILTTLLTLVAIFSMVGKVLGEVNDLNHRLGLEDHTSKIRVNNENAGGGVMDSRLKSLLDNMNSETDAPIILYPPGHTQRSPVYVPRSKIGPGRSGVGDVSLMRHDLYRSRLNSIEMAKIPSTLQNSRPHGAQNSAYLTNESKRFTDKLTLTRMEVVESPAIIESITVVPPKIEKTVETSLKDETTIEILTNLTEKPAPLETVTQLPPKISEMARFYPALAERMIRYRQLVKDDKTMVPISTESVAPKSEQEDPIFVKIQKFLNWPPSWWPFISTSAEEARSTTSSPPTTTTEILPTRQSLPPISLEFLPLFPEAINENNTVTIEAPEPLLSSDDSSLDTKPMAGQSSSASNVVIQNLNHPSSNSIEIPPSVSTTTTMAPIPLEFVLVDTNNMPYSVSGSISTIPAKNITTVPLPLQSKPFALMPHVGQIVIPVEFEPVNPLRERQDSGINDKLKQQQYNTVSPSPEKRYRFLALPKPTEIEVSQPLKTQTIETPPRFRYLQISAPKPLSTSSESEIPEKLSFETEKQLAESETEMSAIRNGHSGVPKTSSAPSDVSNVTSTIQSNTTITQGRLRLARRTSGDSTVSVATTRNLVPNEVVIPPRFKCPLAQN